MSDTQKRGQKHLVECRCILPHLRAVQHPPRHKFVVFSEIDNDIIRHKFAQCNNCGIIHKVVDLCKSEILNGKENISSVPTINDLKQGLSEHINSVLESNSVDVATYEAVRFLLENKLWGDFVVLSSDVIDGLKQVKYIRIMGETLFKVDVATVEERSF